MTVKAKIRVAVVGGSGYVGSELLRLLLLHNRVEVAHVVGHSAANRRIDEVLPSMIGQIDRVFETWDPDVVAKDVDAAFCALPHGTSGSVVRALRERGVVTFDLSADFRLRDKDQISRWYGTPDAPEFIGKAVYGLVELNREDIKSSDLVAVPGCYATASILSVAPLLHANLIDVKSIIVDAKSGASGAGKVPSEATHFCEVTGGIRAYKTAGKHRHTPEIEQALSDVAGESIRITLSPHLVPMSRGILATAYASPKDDGFTAQACVNAATKLFSDSPFVKVLREGQDPDTAWVRGTNYAHLSYAFDKHASRIVGQCTIDNLVKGAAGQAVQCMNVRFLFDEKEGLAATALAP